MSFENRSISTSRNIRQRCQLKYSRHGRLTWGKWLECDCIFSSDIDEQGNQQNQIEFYSIENNQESYGKALDLSKLQSITCMHGNENKNEPKNILILKIDCKRHRLGFDNIFEYNQWKSLFDNVYNSSWDKTNRNQQNEDVAVNMLYESASAMTFRVNFADLSTQEILALPSGECDLIFDNDKLVLEQRQEKQYTFRRSAIRTIRLLNSNEIEFELGSRAPVQGFIRFRFNTPLEARTCYLQWNEGVTPLETSSRESSGRHSMQCNPNSGEIPVIPPRTLLDQDYDCQPPRPPPRGMSTRSPYYNAESDFPSTPDDTQNPYTPFRTLV